MISVRASTLSRSLAEATRRGSAMNSANASEWVAINGADLKEFHRRALGVGSVGLGTLRQALIG